MLVLDEIWKRFRLNQPAAFLIPSEVPYVCRSWFDIRSICFRIWNRTTHRTSNCWPTARTMRTKGRWLSVSITTTSIGSQQPTDSRTLHFPCAHRAHPRAPIPDSAPPQAWCFMLADKSRQKEVLSDTVPIFQFAPVTFAARHTVNAIGSNRLSCHGQS